MSKTENIHPNFNDPTPEGAAFRAEQAMIDADIEGLARDPQLEALITSWEKSGLTHDEIISKLKTYFMAEEAAPQAAE